MPRSATTRNPAYAPAGLPARGGFWLLALALLAASLLLGLTACRSGPQSSRMTTDDFIEMTEQMAQSLLASDALEQRGPDSEPWIVSIDKVENLSSDVMTQAEQWTIMSRLRSAAAMQPLREQKNVRFVIPPERTMQYRQHEDVENQAHQFGQQRQPTHVLAATFRSTTRAHERGRVDLYYCEFEILDLATGVPVWTDRFEYQREARGHIWN